MVMDRSELLQKREKVLKDKLYWNKIKNYRNSIRVIAPNIYKIWMMKNVKG